MLDIPFPYLTCRLIMSVVSCYCFYVISLYFWRSTKAMLICLGRQKRFCRTTHLKIFLRQGISNPASFCCSHHYIAYLGALLFRYHCCYAICQNVQNIGLGVSVYTYFRRILYNSLRNFGCLVLLVGFPSFMSQI